VLGNLVHLQHPGVVTLPGNSHRELATTWDHYCFAPDGDYGTAQGAVSHEFWVTIFSMHDFFFITLVTNVFLVVYFILQLRFWLPEEGNHQMHALEAFNRNAHKLVKDAIFNGRIQANNTY
jgi:hypothetical protein